MAFAGFSPGNQDLIVTYVEATDANIIDCTLLVAPFPCELTYIVEVHGTANGATSTCVPRKCTGTTALTGGTALLTTAFDLESTALTPVVGAITTTAGVKNFATGDRFVLDFTGTLSALVDVNVTAHFKRIGF